MFFIFIGNYSETVKDAKATIELQPHFLKAFVRGKSSNSTRSQVDEESLSGCATSKSLIIIISLCIIFHLFKSYSCVFIQNEKATDPNLEAAMWVCTA